MLNRLTKKLTVRQCNLEHNHRVGLEIFAHYPSNRKLSREEEQEIIDVLAVRPALMELVCTCVLVCACVCS